MRVVPLSVLVCVLGFASAPVALADTEPSALEFTLSSNPERFGDELEIVRPPQRELPTQSSPNRSREAAAAEEAAADEGERVSWGDQEEKDKRSPQH